MEQFFTSMPQKKTFMNFINLRRWNHEFFLRNLESVILREALRQFESFNVAFEYVITWTSFQAEREGNIIYTWSIFSKRQRKLN